MELRVVAKTIVVGPTAKAGFSVPNPWGGLDLFQSLSPEACEEFIRKYAEVEERVKRFNECRRPPRWWQTLADRLASWA